MQCNDCGRPYELYTRLQFTPSPVQNLLHSNEPLSVDQRRAIKRHIERLQDDLTLLEDGEETTIISKALEQRQTRRSAFADLAEKFLSPLRGAYSQIPDFISVLRQLIPELPALDQVSGDSDLAKFIQNVVSQIDQEIKTLSDVLRKKGTKILELQKSISIHQGVLNPFRAIPPEPLSEIFLRCQQGSIPLMLPEIPDAFDPKEGPLLLTQICRRWRNVATSTHQLWTTIRIRVGNQYHRDAQVNLIFLWVARSGICPLRICMVDIGTTSPLKTFDGDSAVEAAFALSQRWKEFHIVLTPHNSTPVWPLMQPILEGNLPLLQECSIISTEIIPIATTARTRQTARQKFTTSLFLTAPRLRKFRLECKHPLSSFKLLPDTLTTLELYMQLPHYYATINEFMTILASFPYLNRLRMACGFADPTLQLPGSVIHPSLRVLNLKAAPLSENTEAGLDFDEMFNRLTLPSLRVLIINATRKRRTWSIESLSELLQRSGGHIEKLSIGSEGMSWPHIVDCLALTPHLNSLKLIVESDDSEKTILTDAILFKLETGGSCPPDRSLPLLILPELQRLEVDARIAASGDAFLDFLYARRNPIDGNLENRLVHLSLYAQAESSGFIGDLIKRWTKLDALRCDGLDITIFNEGIRIFPVLKPPCL